MADDRSRGLWSSLGLLNVGTDTRSGETGKLFSIRSPVAHVHEWLARTAQMQVHSHLEVGYLGNMEALSLSTAPCPPPTMGTSRIFSEMGMHSTLP